MFVAAQGQQHCEVCGDGFKGRSLRCQVLCGVCEERQHARDAHTTSVVARARERCSALDVGILHSLLLEGASLEAIAAALGIPEDEVRSRLAETMARLRTHQTSAHFRDEHKPAGSPEHPDVPTSGTTLRFFNRSVESDRSPG